jgi:pimeloyl-ACP methyl ester carboxylesterase
VIGTTISYFQECAMTSATDRRESRVATSEIEVGGSRIRLLTAGEGEPLLYLHGAGDSGSWLPVLTELAADHTVHRPDLPGFTHSTPSDQIASVHDMAFVMLDLLTELGIDTVKLVGSSLGGWLAADMASIEPGRVSHLVLIGPAGLRPSGGHPADMFVMTPPEIAAATWADPGLRAAALDAVAALDDDQDAMLIHLRNRAATAGLGWNPYFHEPALRNRLHRIRAKTLVAWGEQDGLLPASLTEEWVAAVPGAQSRRFTPCGHLPHIEAASEFIETARPFLAG